MRHVTPTPTGIRSERFFAFLSACIRRRAPRCRRTARHTKQTVSVCLSFFSASDFPHSLEVVVHCSPQQPPAHPRPHLQKVSTSSSAEYGGSRRKSVSSRENAFQPWSSVSSGCPGYGSVSVSLAQGNVLRKRDREVSRRSRPSDLCSSGSDSASLPARSVRSARRDQIPAPFRVRCLSPAMRIGAKRAYLHSREKKSGVLRR